jgi:hypothetical protein
MIEIDYNEAQAILLALNFIGAPHAVQGSIPHKLFEKIEKFVDEIKTKDYNEKLKRSRE